MKIIGTALLGVFLSIGSAGAQQLRGGYASTTKSWVTDLLVFEGNHFTYTQRSCTGLNKGNGTFTVQDNLLVLRFENPASPSPISSACQSCPQAGGISIQVFDKATNEPLPGVVASVAQHGTVTGNDGTAWFSYAPAATDTLKMAMVGYATQFIPLQKAAPNCFTVWLTHVTYIRAGTTYIFPLLALRHHAFVAQLTPNKVSSYSSFHYKHVSAGKARTLMAKWEGDFK